MAGERKRIFSKRKGSVQWNDDDRCQLASLLARAGYSVRIGRAPIEDKKTTSKMEYFVEYWEEEDE